MLIIKIFDLGIICSILFITIFAIHMQSVYGTVDLINNSSSQASNISSTAEEPDSFAVKAGEGNHTVSVTVYFPSYVEITAGDSITWYNGIDVPNPHTVTFIKNLNNIEKIGVPFYIQNDTKFIPVLNDLGKPLEEMSDNGTRIVMTLNARALTPTVITADDKVLNLKRDSIYVYTGEEKFINSGPLLALDKEQKFNYPFNTSFTIVFSKAGFFEYSCLFHPWMVGKILVKP